jgi:hypothetical protein
MIHLEKQDIKIRPFKLIDKLIEFNNPSGKNRIEFIKIDTKRFLNFYINRDLYLTENGFSRLQKIRFDHYKEPITPDLVRQMEDEYYYFFLSLLSSNDLMFEPPGVFQCTITFILDGVQYAESTIKDKEPAAIPPMYKIPAEPNFKYL